MLSSEGHDLVCGIIKYVLKKKTAKLNLHKFLYCEESDYSSKTSFS